MSAGRQPPPFEPARLTVERAIGDLRRGLPVRIVDPLGHRTVALAAETADESMLAALAVLALAPPALALTAARARALSIKPSGHALVLVELPGWADSRMVRELGDATSDLQQPLRGPFSRRKRAPTAGEEAAVALAKLARLLPAVLVAPAAVPAADDGLLSAESEAILLHDAKAAAALRPVAAATVPLADAEHVQLIAYRPADGGVEHLALLVGEPALDRPVLTRLHSECFTGDLLASLKCDCGEQLRAAVRLMAEGEGGILLYLAQEGRGIGLMNKLRAYRLQAEGFDTVDANLRLGFDADERIFGPAAAMLRDLGVRQVRLLTNNPEKVAGLAGLGIDVVERVPHSFPSNTHNIHYLETKRRRGGHLF